MGYLNLSFDRASQVSDWFEPEEESKAIEENKSGNEGLKKVLRKKQQAAEPTQSNREELPEKKEEPQPTETNATSEATA